MWRQRFSGIDVRDAHSDTRLWPHGAGNPLGERLPPAGNGNVGSSFRQTVGNHGLRRTEFLDHPPHHRRRCRQPGPPQGKFMLLPAGMVKQHQRDRVIAGKMRAAFTLHQRQGVIGKESVHGNQCHCMLDRQQNGL